MAHQLPLEKARAGFAARYGYPCQEIWFAPGRINIIGEHIDYNGGPVLPAAIHLGIYLAFGRRPDGLCRFSSDQFDGLIECTLPASNQASAANLVYTPEHGWANYPIGMLEQLRLSGHSAIRTGDFYYYSTLPAGSGLSSSAALELVTGFCGADLENPAPGNGPGSRPAMAALAQQAENQFIGVACGIMDQFAVAAGRRGQALLLHTHNLEHSYIPAQLESAHWVVIDSGKPRSLEHSGYNQRARESAEVAKILATDFALEFPAAAELRHCSQMPAQLQPRLRHIISEVYRVHKTVGLLSDITKGAQETTDQTSRTMGTILNECHTSLKNDFEVSCPELDILQELGRTHEACYGIRMVGAGFGGCLLALVKEDGLDSFNTDIASAYRLKTGIQLHTWPVTLGPGVSRLA